MWSRRPSLKFRSLVLAALLASVANMDALAQAGRQVGVAAAVTGQVQLASAGAGARAGVRSGEAIRLGDQIATGPDSKLQIMLADETVFTIGPNAAITIDEFVFDSASGRGKLTADIARGAFRFVTGRIAAANPQDMKVTMPVGTMGIRGTVVAGRVENDRAMVVLLGPGDQNNANERMGRVLVSGSNANGGSVELRRPGFATEISRGGAPSTPFRLSKEAMDSLLTTLSNAGGRAARAAGGGDSAEEVAEIETAAGDGFSGGSGQSLVDGLRGILSIADVAALLDRPFPTLPGASSAGPLVLRIPDSLIRTLELRSFSGVTEFPVSVFGLTGSAVSGTFSVTARFDHGAGTVSGTLIVDLGGVRETFPISVAFPGGAGVGASASAAAFAAAPAAAGASDTVNSTIGSRVVRGVTLFSLSTNDANRKIDYRYLLMRSTSGTSRPDQMLNGLTYQSATDALAGKTTAAGVGVAQTSGPAIQLTGSSETLGAKVLQLDIKR